MQQPVLNSTEKVSGGNQGGQNSAMGRDHPKAPQVSQWKHGWQYWASSVSDSHFRKTTLLLGSAPPRLVPSSGHTLATTQGPPWLTRPLPRSASSLRICSRLLLLERLQLPLSIDEAVCSGSRALLDPLGRHRAACTRRGRLRKRAAPTERTLARVCWEVGARVRFNAFLRDMNVNVGGTDERRIEVLAQDLPCFGGVNITLRCVLSCVGERHPNTADVDGAALMVAREDKERIYPELTTSGRCRLVVVAIETGGRWSTEAVNFVRQLSFAKAREVPSFMQFSTALPWERRWTRMLSTVYSLSFAASLVAPL